MRTFKMHHPDSGHVGDAVEAMTILAADAFVALIIISVLLGLAI